MIVHRLVLAFACFTLAVPADAAAHGPTPPHAPEPPGFAFAFAPSFEQARPRLGAHVSSMTPELRKFLGAKKDAGILVQLVDADTPAARAGMKVGDVIVSVDGDAIDEIGEVAPALADRGKGDKVDVVVVRNKSRRRLRVVMQDDANEQPRGEDARGEIEQLREQIESLETRVDQLDRARRRSKKAKP
jgi:predicted metalloprotease with PDZ domain